MMLGPPAGGEFGPGPPGRAPDVTEGCAGLETPACCEGAAADEEGAFCGVLDPLAGAEEFGPGPPDVAPDGAEDCPGADGDGAGLEPPPGCDGNADEEGPLCKVFGPVPETGVVGTVTPGGTPGAYDIGALATADCAGAAEDEDPLCVVPGPVPEIGVVGTVTPDGTPGAYDVCPLEPAAGCEGAADNGEGAVCKVLDSLELFATSVMPLCKG